jgi:hypothetical protein
MFYQKMYDLPRPGKDLGRSDEGSPPKCIRPLASELRLQPGHDEIRAHGSQIILRAEARFFAQSLRCADRLFRDLFPSLAFCPAADSGNGRISAFVESPWLGDDHPGRTGNLRRERDSDFVHVHPALQRVEPTAEAIPVSVEMCDTGSGAMDQ